MVCADGSVYAGNSPDGNVPMFVTRCDAGMVWNGSSCLYSRSQPTYNDANSNWTDTSLVNCITFMACDASGETNTTALIAEDSNSSLAGTQVHAAAQTCADLSMHGKTDWYLPSMLELNVMFDNQTAIGNFATSGNPFYWSSSEYNNGTGRYRDFATGVLNNGAFAKNSGWYVRCARR